MNLNKKAQGLGGLIKVFVVGILFMACFPFVYSIFSAISDQFQYSPAIATLVMIAIPLLIWFVLKYAYNLGAEPL